MAHGYGITHVFFMPFIGPRTLMEMEKLGMQRIQPHGEKAAAYMADAYARVKRAPSLCMAQSVGAVNLAAGLQDAYLACSPVIALTGRELPINQQRHAYQEVDHVRPFTTVTKYSASVRTPDLLGIRLRQAFRAATTGTPGPAHLDLDGLAGQAVFDREADLEVIVEEPFTRLPAFRPEADSDQVAQALNRLARAERPVIVAGGGVTASDARAELIAFAEKLSIPVATALNAKAMFPPDHALSVGTPGNYSRECSNRIVCEADLVFFIGSHSGGQVTHGYRIPPQGTPVMQLDINAEELGRNYALDVGLQGDVRNTLRRMIAAADAGESGPDRSAWVARVQELVAAWKEQVRDVWESDIEPMRPGAAVRRAVRLPAGGCDPGVRHRPLRGVDRHHAGPAACRPELHPLRRLARLGAAGGDGRQVCGPRPPGGVLHRRRRHLVSPRGTGDGVQVQPEHGDGGQ